jgi:hypothetical protein
METVQPREAHGVRGIKINVWGAIHPKGVSELVQVDGNLTAVQYVDILSHALVPLYDHYKNRAHTFLYFQQTGQQFQAHIATRKGMVPRSRHHRVPMACQVSGPVSD